MSRANYVLARPMLTPGSPPVVAAGALLSETQLWLEHAYDIGALAAIVEQLADATPAQHRELAAAIRQAAADISEAGQ